MIKQTLTILMLSVTFFSVPWNDAFSDEQRGKQLFEEQRCTRCHTIGRGKFVGPDLFNVKDKYSQNEITQWIEDPQLIYEKFGKMPVNEGYPPMPGLNIDKADARDITDFLINNKIEKSVKDGGDIIGLVINKTDGQKAEGIDVYLQSFIGDRKTGEDLSITDKEGRFGFKNLPWNNSYSIKVKSEGIEYETAKMVFPVDKDEISLKLPIFASTDDSSVIKILLNHQVLGVEGKYLSVAEIYEFENSGESIYIGKKEEGSDVNTTLKIFIPKEARNLNYVEGISAENTFRKNNTVFDTVSFAPGKRRVVLTYDLPLNFGQNLFDKEIYYLTDTVLFLATESGEQLKVEGLNELEPIVVEDQEYLRWVGNNLSPGTKITIDYYSTKIDFTKIELLPVIVFAVFFVTAVLFIMFKIKYGNGSMGIQDIKSEREKIVLNIARLDLKNDRKEIDPKEYEVLRTELIGSLALLDSKTGPVKYPRNKTE